MKPWGGEAVHMRCAGILPQTIHTCGSAGAEVFDVDKLHKRFSLELNDRRTEGCGAVAGYCKYTGNDAGAKSCT